LTLRRPFLVTVCFLLPPRVHRVFAVTPHYLVVPARQKEPTAKAVKIGPYPPDFSLNRTTIRLKIEKIWPRFSTCSLRSLLPRRLLALLSSAVQIPAGPCIQRDIEDFRDVVDQVDLDLPADVAGDLCDVALVRSR